MKRIWIYQSKEKLSAETEASVISYLDAFIKGWAAHGEKLYASYEILFSRFIILKVEEEMVGASGCSIDASVHAIQDLEKKYNLSLLDRRLIAYENKNEISLADFSELKSLFNSGKLTEETILFNNSITTEEELIQQWKKPLIESVFYNMVK